MLTMDTTRRDTLFGWRGERDLPWRIETGAVLADCLTSGEREFFLFVAAIVIASAATELACEGGRALRCEREGGEALTHVAV
jgi:hypothetical protein